MTKKVDGRDLRREPDEAPVEDASRFRIDRVFVPPVKREASGPTPMRPVRGRPLTRPPVASGDSEVVELRRQLSRLQRQLADMSDELANKEDQLAQEVEARLAQAQDHDTLHGQATQLDHMATAAETRANALAERLAGELAQVEQLGRERDGLARDHAALTTAHEALLGERARQDVELGATADVAAERDALTRAYAEAQQRIGALEATLSETHARWNMERKEVEAAHGEEIAELETTLRASTDAAAAELQRLREVVRNDGTSSGLAVAAAKAENERELATMRKELEAAAATLREESAAARTAAATVCDDHDATTALLRAAIHEAKSAVGPQLAAQTEAHAAALAAQSEAHVAALASVRMEAEAAKGGLEGELAKLRMAAGKVRAEHEAALASARAEHAVVQTAVSAQTDKLRAEHEKELAVARHQHVTAKAEAMTEVERVRAEHETALAAARHEHVTAQAEAMTELARVRTEHEAALGKLRGEAEQAVRAAEDKAGQALSEAVLQTAADQVALARRHRQELDRLEEERAGLERGLEQVQRDAAAKEKNWEQTIQGHHAMHDATLDELADATSLGARHAEESGVRGEKIDELTLELDGVRTELATLRQRIEATDATTQRHRDEMAAHLRQGLALLEGPAAKPAGTGSSPDLHVRFRSNPDD